MLVQLCKFMGISEEPPFWPFSFRALNVDALLHLRWTIIFHDLIECYTKVSVVSLVFFHLLLFVIFLSHFIQIYLKSVIIFCSLLNSWTTFHASMLLIYLLCIMFFFKSNDNLNNISMFFSMQDKFMNYSVKCIFSENS